MHDFYRFRNHSIVVQNIVCLKFPTYKLVVIEQALLLSRISSQNIVGYIGSGMASTRDVFWIEMELIKGLSLEQILDSEGPLSERDVIKVIYYMLKNERI